MAQKTYTYKEGGTTMRVRCDRDCWPSGKKVEAAEKIIGALELLMDDAENTLSVMAAEMIIADPPTHYIDLDNGGAVSSWVFSVGGDTLVAYCSFRDALMHCDETAQALHAEGAERRIESIRSMQADLAQVEAVLMEGLARIRETRD